MKIKEIIVVEGKDDTTAIRQAVNADTIETNGSAINAETIEKIKLAKSTRGVIILTDPDYPWAKNSPIRFQNKYQDASTLLFQRKRPYISMEKE